MRCPAFSNAPSHCDPAASRRRTVYITVEDAASDQQAAAQCCSMLPSAADCDCMTGGRHRRSATRSGRPGSARSATPRIADGTVLRTRHTLSSCNAHSEYHSGLRKAATSFDRLPTAIITIQRWFRGFHVSTRLPNRAQNSHGPARHKAELFELPVNHILTHTLTGTLTDSLTHSLTCLEQ